MAIQIIRNQDGNCIEFRGSTNPVYWNACLSAEVDPILSDRINVINDVASAAGGETVYEFYHIPFGEFRDADNDPFLTATDAANYITTNGNVIEVANASYQGVWDADTNSPTLSDGDTPLAGDFYFVSVPGSTTLGGVSTWKQNDRIMWSGSAWQKIPARQIVGASTRSIILNTNTAVYADGEGATADPAGLTAGWYYKNSENAKINWYLFGDQGLDYTLGDFGGFYAVVDFRNTTSAPYWTVYTRFEGDGQDQSWYRSRINYSDYSGLQAAVAANGVGRYLIYSAGMDVSSIEPTIPGTNRVSLPIDASTTLGLQASDEDLYLMALSTSSGRPAGEEEFVVEKVGYQLGDYIQTSFLSSPPTTGASVIDTDPESLDFRIDPTNTTILLDDGSQYGVNSIQAQSNGDGTVDIVALPSGQVIYNDLAFGNLTIQGGPAYTTEQGAVNALNSLFQVQPLGTGGDYDPVYPLLDLDPITVESDGGTVPTTTLSDGTTAHLLTSNTNSPNDAAIWSTETIDTAGEFYTVRLAGQGRFVLGLGSENEGDRTEIALGGTNAHQGVFWSNAFYNYSGNIRPWTYYGSQGGGTYGPGWYYGTVDEQMGTNTSVQDELDPDVNLKDGALFKVGIDAQGYVAVWYYDEGRTNDWIKTARGSYTVPAGEYFLVVKLWDGNITLTQTPERSAVDPAAPALDYRYIESPDGSFDYPLFATQEEAEYVDTANLGSGTFTLRNYPDDPTFSTWYMPDTGSSTGANSAPADTDVIIWDEIPTLADNLFAPGSFDIQDLTVDEGAAVNYQVAPAGLLPYSTTVAGLPSGLSFDGGTVIQGFAPAVADNNVTNPSDSYTVTVTRTNTYGSTVDTFVLTVNNLTAPSTAISGFTWDNGSAPLVDSDTLDDGSVVEITTHLNDGERMIIPKEWIASYALPAAQAGGSVWIGIEQDGGTSWATIEDADFDAAIKISYQTATSHSSRLFTDSSTSNYGIGGYTNGFYDYALEHDGTDLHLIACNVNAINTEPSVNDGGQFARVVTWANHAHTGNHVVVRIAVSGTTMDIANTGIEVLDIPTPPAPTILTGWTKALDFGGNAERTLQVSNSTSHNPLRMGGVNNNAAGNATPGYTSNDTNARPWATACVFKMDGNSSNQHIWNQGEGSGSTDDNIYLRVDASRNLYFGWGRQGELNEIQIGYNLSTSQWYGVYIASTGERLGGTYSASDIADCFEIRVFSSGTNWQIASATNSSTYANWSSLNSSFGARMNRQFEGDFTVGGRGSNRNFHGKVASMVVTTLMRNAPMPSEAEIVMMVTDPVKWMDDYKVGQTYRYPANLSTAIWQKGNYQASFATQVWLMGDGTNDAFAQIRNQAWPALQSYTPLNMISMVSNDIETVSIPGLS